MWLLHLRLWCYFCFLFTVEKIVVIFNSIVKATVNIFAVINVIARILKLFLQVCVNNTKPIFCIVINVANKFVLVCVKHVNIFI